MITSNLGFHSVWNDCREIFDHRLIDNFSDKIYKDIIEALLEVAKNGSDKDELYRAIMDRLSPSGYGQFLSHAQKVTDSVNKLKTEDFEASKLNIIESKFNVNNIEETIKMAKESGLWN